MLAEEKQLTVMNVGEEIELTTVLKDIIILVRKVPNGWIYNYIKTDYDHGNFLQRTMTSTFVSMYR